MRRATKVDTVGAGFAGVCDGTLPAGRIVDAIAQLLGEDPVVLRDRTPESIRLLVEQGFLDPVQDAELPRPDPAAPATPFGRGVQNGAQRHVAHDRPRHGEAQTRATATQHRAPAPPAQPLDQPAPGTASSSEGRGDQQQRVVVEGPHRVAVQQVVGEPGAAAGRAEQAGGPVERAARQPVAGLVRVGAVQIDGSPRRPR